MTNMKLIITKYVFPIADEITISEKFGIYFTNPKTSEEISEIERTLKTAAPDGVSMLSRFGYEIKGDDPFSVKRTLEGIFRNLPQENQYVQQFIETNRDNDPFNTLARIWVIAKINETKIEELKQLHNLQERASSLIKLPIGPFDTEYFLREKVYELATLASLMTCCDKYWDYDSILANSSPINDQNHLSGLLFAYCLMTCFPPQATDGLKHLSWFHQDIDDLLRVFRSIDAELNGENSELFDYLLNLIYTSSRGGLTEKARLLLLVSVVELLLTYSPDYNRFNVEDSISKQFQLKTSIVVYQNNRGRDINEIKQNLKNIYQVRSKIAHGDFKSLRNFIQKQISVAEYNREIEDYYLWDLSATLYTYIKAILEEYFKDHNFIKFIKQT